MAEVIHKMLIGLSVHSHESPREKFQVTKSGLEGVTSDDVEHVKSILEADLANVQPPIPADERGIINIKTGKNFSHEHQDTVSAIYVRSDALTINALQLGYRQVTYPLPL